MNKDSLDFIFRPSGDITQEVTVARMESLRKAAARAQPPRQVIGGKIRTTPDGWTLEINQKANAPSHPWKVTAKGESTVSVAAGEILSFNHGNNGGFPVFGDLYLSSYFGLDVFASYEGGDIELTSDSGFIYAQMDFVQSNGDYSDGSFSAGGDDRGIGLSSIRPDSTVTVAFSDSIPASGNIFTVKIAEVSIVDNSVVVDKQIITYNPTLFVPILTTYNL